MDIVILSLKRCKKNRKDIKRRKEWIKRHSWYKPFEEGLF